MKLLKKFNEYRIHRMVFFSMDEPIADEMMRVLIRKYPNVNFRKEIILDNAWIITAGASRKRAKMLDAYATRYLQEKILKRK